MPPEITRIDVVQGDAQALLFHAYQAHPTAGATVLPSLGPSTSVTFLMRHAHATPALRASLVGSVVDATAGLLRVNLATIHTATAGQYRAQLVIDRGSEVGVQTVPADEPYHVQIRERV